MKLTEKELKARDVFSKMTVDEKISFLSKLTIKQANELKYNPIFWLRDKQIVPDGDWRYCFVRSGRGFRKNKNGSFLG